MNKAQVQYTQVMALKLNARMQNSLCVSLLLASGIVLYYILFLYKCYYIPLVLILTYLLYVSGRSGSKIPVKYFGILVACYAYLFISTFWSPLRSFGIYKLEVESVYYLFAFFPALSVSCTDDVKLRLIQASSFAYCVTAVIALLTVGDVGDVVDPTKGSLRSTYGTIFLVAIPSLVFLASKRKSVLAWVTLAAILVISLFLNNRTLLVFGPIMLLVSLFLINRERMRSAKAIRIRIGAVILGLPLLFATLNTLGLSKVYQRVTHGTSMDIGRDVLREQLRAGTQEDLERRVYTFVSLTMFLNHPLLGAGFGSSPYYVHKVSKFDTAAHGLATMLPAETGLIGTSLFAYAILLALTGFRARLRCSVSDDERLRVMFEVLTLVSILLVGAAHQVYDDIYFYLFVGTGLYYRSQTPRTNSKGRLLYRLVARNRVANRSNQ